jgi:hypothetical protein
VAGGAAGENIAIDDLRVRTHVNRALGNPERKPRTRFHPQRRCSGGRGQVVRALARVPPGREPRERIVAMSDFGRHQPRQMLQRQILPGRVA